MVSKPLPARACGFESHLRHPYNLAFPGYRSDGLLTGTVRTATATVASILSRIPHSPTPRLRMLGPTKRWPLHLFQGVARAAPPYPTASGGGGPFPHYVGDKGEVVCPPAAGWGKVPAGERKRAGR
jgi:hypothetical protein